MYEGGKEGQGEIRPLTYVYLYQIYSASFVPYIHGCLFQTDLPKLVPIDCTVHECMWCGVQVVTIICVLVLIQCTLYCVLYLSCFGTSRLGSHYKCVCLYCEINRHELELKFSPFPSKYLKASTAELFESGNCIGFI